MFSALLDIHLKYTKLTGIPASCQGDLTFRTYGTLCKYTFCSYGSRNMRAAILIRPNQYAGDYY